MPSSSGGRLAVHQRQHLSGQLSKTAATPVTTPTLAPSRKVVARFASPTRDVWQATRALVVTNFTMSINRKLTAAHFTPESGIRLSRSVCLRAGETFKTAEGQPVNHSDAHEMVEAARAILTRRPANQPGGKTRGLPS